MPGFFDDMNHLLVKMREVWSFNHSQWTNVVSHATAAYFGGIID
jgi:hypothetical protein